MSRTATTPDDAAHTLETPCPLCASVSRVLLSRRDRRGKPLDTAICRTCGLVSHARVPTEEALRAYYTNRYRAEYNHEETPSARRVMRAWRQGQRLVRLLAPFAPAGAAVHEFGAGIGCTVKGFEFAGYDATGVEPGVGFQRYAVDRLRARVRRATLDEPHDGPAAHLGLLVHVIEHLRDPVAALESIRDRLAPDGMLYIECPNLAAPFATFGRMFHEAHIYNFTAATLDAAAARAGLRCVEQFGRANNPNLARLYRLSEPSAPTDPEACARTLRAVRRLNIITYHARPRYLRDRARKVTGYLTERMMAPIALRLLEQRCAAAG